MKSMQSMINKKINEILDNFNAGIKMASEIKDNKISELLENAENEYIEKIKNDIKI